MAAQPTNHMHQEHQDEGARLVELNVNKAREVASWLDSLGTTVAPDDRAALSADLSDLYVSATHYQLMLDRLLAARTTERETTVELLGETVSELRHAGDHIRSAVKRLDRLTLNLDEAD